MKILKNRILKTGLLLFVLSLITANFNQITAQDTIPINLEIVLELGGADNLTIKAYKERQELSAAKLTKAKEWWLPEIYAGAQTHQLWGVAMNADGRFFQEVDRQNLWAGIGLNANWDFADGIYAKKSAEYMNRAQEFTSQAQRNQELLEMISVYYDLLTAQLNYNAYEKLVGQADTISQQIALQVETGLRYESELLLAKSNKNQLKAQMLNAKRNYNQASVTLKKMLNIEQNVKLVSLEQQLLPLDYSFKEAFQTQESSNDSIYLDRPEIKANSQKALALEMERKKYTTGLLVPELNIGTYGSYFGKIDGRMSPMFPNQFQNTNQLEPTGVLNVSLLWEIPLGLLTSQGDKKIIKSKERINKIESEQLRVQVNQEIAGAKSDLQIRTEQIKTTKEALDLTSKALYQSIERQKIGTAKPFEVFQAQQFFLQAQLDYLQAVSQYNKAQYALKVAKGENL